MAVLPLLGSPVPCLRVSPATSPCTLAEHGRRLPEAALRCLSFWLQQNQVNEPLAFMFLHSFPSPLLYEQVNRGAGK